MAVLVTGGSGYIGSHICVELLSKGHNVVVVDNLSNSSSESLLKIQQITGESVRFYNADLLDVNTIETIFVNNLIDAVIHLAGYKAVGESVEKPLGYYRNNIVGTLNLCQIMNKFDVKKLVFSSSATVYQPIGSGAISENSLLGASNPYGRTKLMIEEILRDLSSSDDGWSISLLRYFNPIGAHPSGLIGEDPNGIPNNLIPYITQVAVGKMDKLYVYGNDYPTLDGTGIRDYIHVVDLALGHLKALEQVMLTVGVEAYNLGTGRGYSVLEILKIFEKITGRKIPYIIVDRRPGDIAISYADPTKANRELNWLATRGIEEMCADAWRWQLNNPNGYIGKVASNA
jgi:UDP-glucose 4-epimerase